MTGGGNGWTHPSALLPDGRFVYYRQTGGTYEVGVASPGDAVATTPLRIPNVSNASGMVFVPPDRLVYVAVSSPIMANGGMLSIQRVDPETLEPVGPATRYDETVGAFRGLPGLAPLTASGTGPAIAYRRDVLGTRQLVWLDRAGRTLGLSAGIDGGTPVGMRFSTDGQALAFRRNGGLMSMGNMWMMNTDDGQLFEFRSGTSRLAFLPGGDEYLVSGVTNPTVGNWGFFRRPVRVFDGPGVRLADPVGGFSNVQDVSVGGYLLYDRATAASSSDLLVVPLAGGTPIAVADSVAEETNGRFSPDGDWIAYQSDADGAFEIYVQRFGALPNQGRNVSLAGGMIPQWSADGSELFFLSADDHVMVVDVEYPEFGTELELSEPRPLFPEALPHGSTFEMHPDGERLIVNQPVGDPAPIILLPSGVAGLE